MPLLELVSYNEEETIHEVLVDSIPSFMGTHEECVIWMETQTVYK
jgi:hypothetical protein